MLARMTLLLQAFTVFGTLLQYATLASPLWLPVMPRRWLAPLAVGVGAGTVAALALEKSIDDPGIGDLLDHLFLINSASITTFLIAARMAVQTWMTRDAGWPKPGPIEQRGLRPARILCGVVIGGCAGAHGMRWLSLSLAGSGVAVPAHAALAACVLAALWGAWRGWARAPGFAAALGASALASAAFLIASLQHPNAVLRAAQSASEARPACLVMSGPRPHPTSWRDLTLLTMAKSNLGHGWLLVETDEGPRYLHWSYFDQRFTDGDPPSWRPTCVPRPDFAERPLG